MVEFEVFNGVDVGFQQKLCIGVEYYVGDDVDE